MLGAASLAFASVLMLSACGDDDGSSDTATDDAGADDSADDDTDDDDTADDTTDDTDDDTTDDTTDDDTADDTTDDDDIIADDDTADDTADDDTADDDTTDDVPDAGVTDDEVPDASTDDDTTDDMVDDDMADDMADDEVPDSGMADDEAADSSVDECNAEDPPVTEHNSCSEIASFAEGDEGFSISSPDFEFCGPMPDELTCNGKEFGTGASPELEWSGAPEGTMSYALVFKDIAILEDGDPALDRFAYHWVMWDIPADVTGLPAGMSDGYNSTDVPGALQWATRNNNGFFPPCPNPFPADDERFSCELLIDSYSFTLYALPTETLEDLPEADINPDTGMPSGNWVVNMGHYIESLDALAVAEYRGTSDAWATSFAIPDPAQYPCGTFEVDTDAGATECLEREPDCEEDPPITEHNSCTDIASIAEGDPDFTISSPDFDFCGEIPAEQTCDGNAFGTGSSPELEWSGAPEGTMSYALVFKDIAILEDGDPALDRFAYHWVMWDIPADTMGLPAGMTGGYNSTDVPGAHQWAGRNNYAYFPPCPNPFPAFDERYSCELVIDSYSYTLYALPVETLEDLPEVDINPDTGEPAGNWVVNMGHYIESLDALAVAEYRGTSGAWASSFAPPAPAQYPCDAIAATDVPDAGADSGAIECLE
jgi:phosphatidylethanolamine-binding protein (PEBP) family uncharacterized protein